MNLKGAINEILTLKTMLSLKENATFTLELIGDSLKKY